MNELLSAGECQGPPLFEATFDAYGNRTGLRIASPWYREICIEPLLLRDADPTVFQYDAQQRTVRIVCDNGEAVYRIDRPSTQVPGYWHAVNVSWSQEVPS